MSCRLGSLPSLVSDIKLKALQSNLSLYWLEPGGSEGRVSIRRDGRQTERRQFAGVSAVTG